jgi:acetolactate synthase-1/2/3 large subunit
MAATRPQRPRSRGAPQAPARKAARATSDAPARRAPQPTRGTGERRRLSGAQIVAEYLRAAGVRYAAGIPGHGSWSIVDAITDHVRDIELVQVMHEQSAVHLADGFYRASGQPLAAFTSIGPGAANTVMAMATAYVDSTAVLLLTGSPHTHMRGRGVLQELERTHDADFPRVMEGVTKRWWQPSRVEDLPMVLHRAFNEMLTGRPGPVHLDLPMDVQADSAEVSLPSPERRTARGRPRPDAALVERAAAMLAEAERPVIVAGGGVITSGASGDLVALAERLGAFVVTTWMGKGAIGEDHALFAGAIGDTASTSGNRLASEADVILAVGCRFTDWSCSSYRSGVTFAIPPSRLIHLDIDPREIGKNYPVEVPLVGDAKAGLADLLDAVGERRRRATGDGPYFAHGQTLKREWAEQQAKKRESKGRAMSQQRAVWEIRGALDRDAIVVTGAGLPQAIVRQDWLTYEPRTHLTSGGYSSMGFTVPAAIGAKLARPERQVVAVAGDGDFLQTMQELAVAAMRELPVLFVVLNNSGWISIAGGQLANFGHPVMTEFTKRDGSAYSPRYAEIAREFGIPGERIDDPAALGPAVRTAVSRGGAALIEVTVAREFPDAGLIKTGWWDVPVPEWHGEQRDRYLAGRAEEQN